MKNHGFTMTEIIITIALISIISAIAAPNFIEMRKREDAKADMMKIFNTIRQAQMDCITQARTGIIVFGNSRITSNLYQTTEVETLPIIEFTTTSEPTMPTATSLVSSTSIFHANPVNFTNFYVDRRGLLYYTDPDTKLPKYDVITLCLDGRATVISGNQIRTGFIQAGKDCKAEEVVF